MINTTYLEVYISINLLFLIWTLTYMKVNEENTQFTDFKKLESNTRL